MITPSEIVAPTSAKTTLRQKIRLVVSAIGREDFGGGARASLCRGAPRDVIMQPAFHRAMAAFDDDDESRLAFDEAIRWGTIIQAAALGARIGTIDFQVRSGEVLADSGLSESRFAKLLATGGEAFRDQFLMIARYLAAKQHPFLGTDLCKLVIHEGRQEERADTLRLNIARDYYRSARRPHDQGQGAPE